MTVPIYMHVFDRPQEAYNKSPTVHTLGRFYGRHLCFDYKHKIVANGGFDVATLELKMRREEAENFLLSRLGSAVQFYADNAHQLIWEGIINRITIDTGSVEVSISLDEMMNRVKVELQSSFYSPQHIQTVEVGTVASQDKYGDIYGSYQWGPHYAMNWTTSGPNILRDLLKELYAWPLIAVKSSNSNAFSIKLNCQGYYHTLKYDNWHQPATATLAVSNAVFSMLWYWAAHPLASVNSSVYNSRGVFYNDLDYQSTFVPNTSYNINVERRDGTTIWDHLLKLAEPGDGSSPFVIGIDPWNPNLRYRRPYYRPAQVSTVKYVTRAYGDPRIYTPQGRLVQPWDVRPDAIIRVTDLLPSWGGEGADPRFAYIYEVSYDSNQSYAVWQTRDNRSTNVNAAFATDVKKSRKQNAYFQVPLKTSTF